jgi:hypothetical protein
MHTQQKIKMFEKKSNKYMKTCITKQITPHNVPQIKLHVHNE